MIYTEQKRATERLGNIMGEVGEIGKMVKIFSRWQSQQGGKSF